MAVPEVVPIQGKWEHTQQGRQNESVKGKTRLNCTWQHGSPKRPLENTQSTSNSYLEVADLAPAVRHAEA